MGWKPVGTQFSGSLMAITFRKLMGTSFLLQSRSRAEVFCLRKSFQTNTQEYLFN
ncbi:8270_t:CDS:2 [Funneliformis caledonium]|uniref:8270_t:CDS:1 n=1 Tax=Funneliformis caledonium TaxID=1117310 RepID=A0A9N9DM65_9GLOM|nr:8270_t:CDS:2 [Funneliformis caledonium]